MKEVFSVIGALFLSVFSFAQSITQSGLSPDRFDEVIDGKRTGLYTLVTSGGMEACVTNYGARLVSLMYQGKDLVLDCTGLEYIASSGLRILMNLVKKAKAQGERVALKNVNEVIRDVLELTGFVSLFEFE